MTPEKQKTFAVLTGDLVDSSKLAPTELKTVMQSLRDAAARFNQTYPDSIIGKLDIYSGDGWQMLMSSPELSLRAALYLRATVKSHKKAKLDTRVAIGWGKIDVTSTNPDRISESVGEAFTASGRALSEMERGVRMVLSTQVVKKNDQANSIVPASILLLDDIVSRWKPAQARAVALSLLGCTQEQVAHELNISQPTANQAVRGAAYAAIERFLKNLEE